MTAKTKDLIISIAIPLITGGLSAIISRSGMQDFSSVAQPPLSPPAILFPIVWTVLYILMGIASYMVSLSDKDTGNALKLYGIQLGVNFFWSIFFFVLGLYWFSFLWLVLLWVLIVLTIISFHKISNTAAYLMIPYLLWVSFAGYLNLGIALLN